MIIISGTVAEVNVSRLIGNVNEIKKAVGRDVKICAVVKANAYGHGAVETARRTERAVDCFAVSLIEEGVELRLCGIVKPVIILLPADPLGAERAIRYGLTLSADSMPYVKSLNGIAGRLNKKVCVHLAVNTGMNRFGFSFPEFEGGCNYVKLCKNVEVTGCFSHFYNPSDAAVTERQFERFLSFKEIAAKYFRGITYHISASGGIIAGRKYDMDMVRPGLLIYGYKPFESDFPVKPVLSVKAEILKELRVKKGENVLYGNYVAHADKTLYLVRAGYADGIRRNGKFSVNNKCMDVCAVEAAGKRDGTVTVFDDADAFAEAENTISYEILCGVTRRARIEYRD
ncbi:MAG: alanine racemase [Clostridia bacterium]|nr:alanine racemase [Clostridia bacterium]